MKTFGQLALGLGSAAVAILILAASMVASQAEAGLSRHPPGLMPSSTPTVVCIPPAGWQPMQVQSGEDLALLARRAGFSLDALLAGNCRSDPAVSPGSVIYLPPTPTSTATSTPTRAPTVTPSAPPSETMSPTPAL
ncbi:MAG: hypothetical protein AB1449_02735 [Chloroflexota bacterium]